MKPCLLWFAIVFTITLTQLGVKAVASNVDQASAVSVEAQNLWKDEKDGSGYEKNDDDCEDVLASRAVTIGINNYAIKIPCLQSHKVDVGGYCPSSAFVAIGTTTIAVPAGSTSTLNPTAVCGTCSPAIVEIDGTSVTVPAGGNINVGSFCPTSPAFGVIAIGTGTFTVPAGGTTDLAATAICGTCSVGTVEINSNTVTVSPCSTIDVGSYCPTYPEFGTLEIGSRTISVAAGSLVSTDCANVCGTCPTATALVSGTVIPIPCGDTVDVGSYCATSAVVEIGTIPITAICGRATSIDPSSVCPVCEGATVTVGASTLSLSPGENTNVDSYCPSATLAIGSQAFTIPAGVFTSVDSTVVCPTSPPETAYVVVGKGATALTTSLNCGTGTYSLTPLPLPDCTGSFFAACVPTSLLAENPQSLVSASYLNMFDVRTRVLSSGCVPLGGVSIGAAVTGFAGYLYDAADFAGASTNCAKGGTHYSMQCHASATGGPENVIACP